MTTETTAISTESITERALRLELDISAASPKRLSNLARAHELGVDDETFVTLVNARAIGVKGEIVLRPGRYDHCSRGKGWARQGRGDSAIWGELVTGGYRVSRPGKWTVGSTDGFNRKDQRTDEVLAIRVGDEAWLVN